MEYEREVSPESRDTARILEEFGLNANVVRGMAFLHGVMYETAWNRPRDPMIDIIAPDASNVLGEVWGLLNDRVKVEEKQGDARIKVVYGLTM